MHELLLNFILRRPFLVIVLIVALCVPAVCVLITAEFSPSIVESFVDDPRDYHVVKELETQFSGNPDSLIWLATKEDDQLFTYATLNAIRKASRQIEQIAEVRRVMSLPQLERPASAVSGLRGTTQKILLNAKLKQGVVPTLVPRPVLLLPDERAANEIADPDLRHVKEEILASQNYARRFLSEDGNSHLMLIELQDGSMIPPARQVALVHQLIQILEQNNLGNAGIYCSGLIPLQAYAFEEIGLVLKTILPVGGILVGLAVLLVFRRVEVICVILIIALISVVWGLSLAILAFGKISLLMAAVPLMVLVISTADVIHLISSYTAERSNGVPHARAVRKTFLEVGGACVLTSITTFIGFASLVFVPSSTIRQFGFAAAAGVASALILSVILVPIFLDWLAAAGRPLAASTSASRLSRGIAQTSLQLALRWPRSTVIGFVILLFICATLAIQVRLDPDLTRRFSADHPITQSSNFFDQQFGGISTVEILLRGEPEKLLQPDTLRKIQSFASECEQQQVCRTADSVSQLLAQIVQRLDYQNPDGIPESYTHAKAILTYVRQFQPALVDSLVSSDGRQLRILMKVQATSYLEMLDRSSQIAEKARGEFGDPLEVIEKGSAPVIGRAVREIIRGHLQGFLFCFTTIFFLIAIGLRSLQLAWISILPNLTPLLVLGGLIGMDTDVVDSDLLAVASLGLGLSVDDTIHFLSRYQIELKSAQTPRHALQSSMDHTGLAIVRTTLILSVGFLPFAFSEYWSINMLGTYLIAVLLAALLADLILLPAMVLICAARQ